MNALRTHVMKGKDIVLLTTCVARALNRDEPDPETRDDVQRAVIIQRAVGQAVIGDVLLALFDIRDDMRALKGAMTK